MEGVFIPTEPVEMLADFDLAKKIAEVLHAHYPGHHWAVEVKHKSGIATVRNLRLSAKFGFYLHIADLKSDPGLKLVVTTGGELLERWNVLRKQYTPERVAHVPLPVGFR